MKTKSASTKDKGRTKIQYMYSISEEGGLVELSVEASSPKTAEKLFDKIHKKYSNYADHSVGKIQKIQKIRGYA